MFGDPKLLWRIADRVFSLLAEFQIGQIPVKITQHVFTPRFVVQYHFRLCPLIINAVKTTDSLRVKLTMGKCE